MTKRQIIFIVVFVISLAGIGYNLYRYSTFSAQRGVISNTTALESGLVELRRLKTSKLDLQLFENPSFKILEPSGRLSAPRSGAGASTTPETQSRVGRANPFLSISGKQ